MIEPLISALAPPNLLFNRVRERKTKQNLAIFICSRKLSKMRFKQSQI